MITTIIPVYNTKLQWLKECVNSILSQTIQTPVLIIDDGSDDKNVINYCKELSTKFSNWKYHQQGNTGISGVMNQAIHLSTTEWILKLDSDDVALPKLTETLLQYIYRYPSTGAVCCQLNAYERGVWRLRSELPENISVEFAYGNLPHWIMNHTGVLLNKYALIQAGGYPEYRQSFSEDYELWINMLLNGEELRSIPEYLVDYRIAGVGSLSHRNKNSKNDKFLEANRRKLEWLLKP